MRSLKITPFHEMYKIAQATLAPPAAGSIYRDQWLPFRAKNPKGANFATFVQQLTPEQRQQFQSEIQSERIPTPAKNRMLQTLQTLQTASPSVGDAIETSTGAKNSVPQAGAAAAAPGVAAPGVAAPGAAAPGAAAPGVEAPKYEFGDDELRFEATDEEKASGKSAIEQLERDYHEIVKHTNSLSQELKEDFAAWRPVFDSFKVIQPMWKALRQQLYANPGLVNRINPQALQAAQQSVAQTLPMIAQMAQQSQQDDVTRAQYLQSVQQSLQAIQSLVQQTGLRAAPPAGSPATARSRPRLTAYAASAEKLFKF